MKRCSNYSQSIQFTFQHKTFLSFEDAKRALVNKNLLPAEPAVVFYYAGNPRKEHVMLGIGNEHDSSEPLIITESISPFEAEQILTVLGNEPIQIPVYTEDGEVSYITTVTGALNYLANAIDTDNFLGDFDSGDDLGEAFKDFAYPFKESGVYTYKIHYDDGTNSIAQLEIYTDNDNRTVQVYTNTDGHKVTRTKKGSIWTDTVEVVPFTVDYLHSIIGDKIINDAVTSRNSTWSSWYIETELTDIRTNIGKIEETISTGDINLDADKVNTSYIDPNTGVFEKVTQQEFNEKVIASIAALESKDSELDAKDTELAQAIEDNKAAADASIAELVVNINANKAAVDASIAELVVNINANKAAVDASITVLEAKDSELAQVIEDNKIAIDASIDELVASINANKAVVYASIAELEAEDARLAQSIEDNKAAVDASIAVLEAKDIELEAKLEQAIEDNKAAVDASIAELVVNINANKAAVDASIAALEAKDIELEAKDAELEQAIEDNKAAVDASFAVLEAAMEWKSV